MPLFLENPPGGSGSGQDRFAPKYVVGNIANGDSATAYSTGGFYYFPDPGDGTGIAAALAAATSTDPGFVALGDVWIRPGTYAVSATLAVPAACTVRGSGPATAISSVANAVPGALFSLGNLSSLRDMTLTHTTPTDTTGSFGVVDLRGDGISAYCENVTVAVGTGGFAGTAVSSGFSVSNVGGAGITKLRLSRCSVVYGGNGSGGYPLYLVGYRMTDACLEMEDCDSTYVPGAPNGNGYSVIASTVQADPEQSFLRIVGGKFKSPFGSVYWTATNADYPVWISETHIKSQLSGAGGGGIYIEKRARANIDSVLVESVSSPCVYFDATGGYDSFNVGTLSHSTLLSVSSKAWNSVGAPASGYHTIIGNTYREAVASTSGANDEVAHNIAIP